MTSTEKALLDLLRIAMGNGINNSLPTGVDWDKVVALAEKQGVLSIAFDALEELPTNLRPSFDALMSWIGHVSFSESIYEKYEQLILHFSRLLLMQGVNAIVMKGYGCSLNCPSPIIALVVISIYLLPIRKESTHNYWWIFQTNSW